MAQKLINSVVVVGFLHKDFTGSNTCSTSLSISSVVRLCREVLNESSKKNSAAAGQEDILLHEINKAVLLVRTGIVSAAGRIYHAEIVLSMPLPVMRLVG